jgi:hypothetical protein
MNERDINKENMNGIKTNYKMPFELFFDFFVNLQFYIKS